MIREKRVKSGKLLEVDFYPVFSDGRRLPSRAPKTKISTAAQSEYNRKQAVKKLVRLINANFDENDIIMHPTYSQECAPQSEEQARRDIVNYLRRVKTKREKELKRIKKMLGALPEGKVFEDERKALVLKIKKLSEDFKYVYCIEKVTYKTGKKKGLDNWHFHLFLTGGLEREVLEKMWPLGMRCNADRFQPERYGPEAIAKYMSKDPQGNKRFSCSKNLKKPQVLKPKDNSYTARGVMRLAKERVDDKSFWEKKYKGYRFLKCYSRYNEYNGYWYVSIVMYQNTSGPPPVWDIENWLDE